MTFDDERAIAVKAAPAVALKLLLGEGLAAVRTHHRHAEGFSVNKTRVFGAPIAEAGLVRVRRTAASAAGIGDRRHGIALPQRPPAVVLVVPPASRVWLGLSLRTLPPTLARYRRPAPGESDLRGGQEASLPALDEHDESSCVREELLACRSFQ